MAVGVGVPCIEWGTPITSKLQPMPVLRQGSTAFTFFRDQRILGSPLCCSASAKSSGPHLASATFTFAATLRIWPLYYAPSPYTSSLADLERGTGRAASFFILPRLLTYTYTWLSHEMALPDF